MFFKLCLYLNEKELPCFIWARTRSKTGYVSIPRLIKTCNYLDTLHGNMLHFRYMFQKFILKKLIGSKLKAAGMSDAQVEQLLEVVANNPDFFKKIQDQVEAKKKQGIPEQAAMMTVMRENQAELQKILTGINK